MFFPETKPWANLPLVPVPSPSQEELGKLGLVVRACTCASE